MRFTLSALVLSLGILCAGLSAQPTVVGDFAPAVLESEAQALEFAESLIHTWRQKGIAQQEVELLHVEGRKLSPYLHTVLAKLRAEGYQVRGTFVTPAVLDQASDQSPEGAVAYSGLSYVDKRRWVSRLFGLPEGVTFFGHFLKEQDGKIVSRFGPDKNISRTAWQTTSLAALTVAGMRVLIPWLLNEPAPNYGELAATTTVLSSWVYYFMTQRRQWASFRTQGSQVVVQPQAAAGEQIQVCANARLFGGACVVQEHVLTSLLASSMLYFGTMQATTPGEWASLVTRLSTASTLAAMSYVPFEQVVASEIGEMERVRASDPAQADRLGRRVGFLTKFYYNVLYPIASNSGRFFSGIWSSVPLAVLGAGSWWWKSRHLPTAPLRAHPLEEGRGCSAVLAVSTNFALPQDTD